MRKAFVTDSTIKGFRANRILFYVNTKLSSLFMVVSGMDIKTAGILLYPKPERNGGLIRLVAILLMMKKPYKLYKKMAGKLLFVS